LASVTLTNVFKRYDNAVNAVNNVNLTINDKEFMVLVGPSGCGKTTTMRMIAGLEEITDGSIFIGSKLVNDLPPKDRDIAMVFQNYALYPHMTVYDNMAFGLKIRKVPKEEIRRRVNEAAQLLGITDYLTRKPKALSGGQRQRAAVGRAIVREPQVFLMDEPLSNLDAQLRVQTRAELIKLHRRLGITTVYVTHDQVEAMTMGDRIAVMRSGVLQQCDTPMEVFTHPANVFVAGFIGTPGMNFFPATVGAKEGGGFTVEFAGFLLDLPQKVAGDLKAYVGKPVIFGIRPTDIFAAILKNPIPATPGNTVKAVIDVAEHMGDKVTVYATVGEKQLVAVFDGDFQSKHSEELDLIFDLEKCHLFEVDTETAIF
jgi:multiple sugar transport system ATP-binding protein